MTKFDQMVLFMLECVLMKVWHGMRMYMHWIGIGINANVYSMVIMHNERTQASCHFVSGCLNRGRPFVWY